MLREIVESVDAKSLEKLLRKNNIFPENIEKRGNGLIYISRKLMIK